MRSKSALLSILIFFAAAHAVAQSSQASFGAQSGTVAVPEPASVLLLGTGLLGLALSVRKRK